MKKGTARSLGLRETKDSLEELVRDGVGSGVEDVMSCNSRDKTSRIQLCDGRERTKSATTTHARYRCSPNSARLGSLST